MLDKAYEEQNYFLGKMLKKGAGPLFRFAGPEVCTPPYMPHELFEKYVTFYDKKLIRLIHDHGQYARIHSHGKIKTVIRDFLEMEVDAIDPVEAPDSGDLTLKEAKALCGNSICLMGNLQLKDLEFLPAAEMRETVKQCVRVAILCCYPRPPRSMCRCRNARRKILRLCWTQPWNTALTDICLA